MEDMDSVIKPRPPSIKQKKPRPKSMHRDITESPKPQAQTYTGTATTQLKTYSADCILLLQPNIGIMDENNRYNMKTQPYRFVTYINRGYRDLDTQLTKAHEGNSKQDGRDSNSILDVFQQKITITYYFSQNIS